MESRLVVALEWGLAMVAKGQTFGMTEVFCVSVVVMITCLYTVVKAQIIHLKCVHFTGCKLYTNKGNFF